MTGTSTCIGKAGHATTTDVKDQQRTWLLCHTELGGHAGVAEDGSCLALHHSSHHHVFTALFLLVVGSEGCY